MFFNRQLETFRFISWTKSLCSFVNNTESSIDFVKQGAGFTDTVFIVLGGFSKNCPANLMSCKCSSLSSKWLLPLPVKKKKKCSCWELKWKRSLFWKLHSGRIHGSIKATPCDSIEIYNLQTPACKKHTRILYTQASCHNNPDFSRLDVYLWIMNFVLHRRKKYQGTRVRT